MSFPSTENLNVVSFEAMPSPQELHQRVPLADAGAQFVAAARATLCRVLDRSDPRLLVIVGPCSIHDPAAGLDYARRLRALAAEVQDSLYLVMRVYFEKPRTVTGWKGFINDPHMDDSFHIEEGMERARRFLVDLTAMGLPAATEALDPAAPQYLGDLIAWYAIGARTSESQTHREMASGLSAPVGFKNATDGNIGIAINAIRSAREPHTFLGITADGTQAIVHTRGNRYGHIVLRGGQTPNYDSAQVSLTEQELAAGGVQSESGDRLRAREFAEEAGAAAAGVQGLRAPDHRGQQLHRRTDAGEQPGRGQSADPAGQIPADLRLFGDRPLHQLGDDGQADTRIRGGLGAGAARARVPQRCATLMEQTAPADLNELAALIRAFARERDWDQFHTPKNLAMGVAIEAAELMEEFHWLTPEQSPSFRRRRCRRCAMRWPMCWSTWCCWPTSSA